MPKTLVFKASFSILTCLIMFAAMAYSVFAEEATTGATNRKLNTPQKINIRQEKTQNMVGALQEKIASRTAAFETRLEKFKDKTKAIIAKRVNTNLNRINQNQTTQMQKNLSTMSNILDRLEKRVNQGSPAAVLTARTTIATVSAAIETQAQKDYTVQVTSEAKIKTDVKTQRDKLHTDLQASRKMVIDAKKSVADAIRAAKSGPKEATNSGQ